MKKEEHDSFVEYLGFIPEWCHSNDCICFTNCGCANPEMVCISKEHAVKIAEYFGLIINKGIL